MVAEPLLYGSLALLTVSWSLGFALASKNYLGKLYHRAVLKIGWPETYQSVLAAEVGR